MAKQPWDPYRHSNNSFPSVRAKVPSLHPRQLQKLSQRQARTLHPPKPVRAQDQGQLVHRLLLSRQAGHLAVAEVLAVQVVQVVQVVRVVRVVRVVQVVLAVVLVAAAPAQAAAQAAYLVRVCLLLQDQFSPEVALRS